MRGSGYISVWVIALDDAHDCGWELLAAKERRRAERLRSPERRSQLIATRAAVRKVLGFYLGEKPELLTFIYNPHGKPSVRDSNLHFNVSHSEELSLIAISQLGAVGVDVECVNGMSGTREYVQHWTRQEAYIKARGWAMPLNPVAIDAGWRVQALELPKPGFVASIAALGHDWEVEYKAVCGRNLLLSESLADVRY